MTRALTPVENALHGLLDHSSRRVLEEVIEQLGVPINLSRLTTAAIVVGMDMGMTFAIEFPAEARVVLAQVIHGAGLTEADRAQKMLLFQELVKAAGA